MRHKCEKFGRVHFIDGTCYLKCITCEKAYEPCTSFYNEEGVFCHCELKARHKGEHQGTKTMFVKHFWRQQ